MRAALQKLVHCWTQMWLIIRNIRISFLDASSESKIAIDEFSEAVYSSISAGVDQTKAISFTTDAMKLAKGGFTDGAKSGGCPYYSY